MTQAARLVVTAILPAPDIYMPTIEQYMALAEAMHDADRAGCAANYVVPFSECGLREFDCQDAVLVLVGLHKAGWTLTHDPAGTVEMGL